jgi:hypothetical protein
VDASQAAALEADVAARLATAAFSTPEGLQHRQQHARSVRSRYDEHARSVRSRDGEHARSVRSSRDGEHASLRNHFQKVTVYKTGRESYAFIDAQY